MRNVAEDECNISSSRIASNLLLSHIALLSGNESDARRYILKAREIQKSNVDLNRFSNDIIWHEASLESRFEHYDKAIPLAAKLTGSGNTIDKFKGYLVLASTYRCLNDIKNAENNLFKAKEALDKNDDSYSYHLAYLLLEWSKLSMEKHDFIDSKLKAYDALQIGKKGEMIPIMIEAHILIAGAESGENNWNSVINHISNAEKLDKQLEKGINIQEFSQKIL